MRIVYIAVPPTQYCPICLSMGIPVRNRPTIPELIIISLMCSGQISVSTCTVSSRCAPSGSLNVLRVRAVTLLYISRSEALMPFLIKSVSDVSTCNC